MPLRSKLIAALFLLPVAASAQELICPQVGADEAPDFAEPGDGRVRLSADQVEITQEGLSTLAGTVRLIQGGTRFEAQALSYDEQERRVRVQAESLFRNRDLIVRSREAEFDLTRESGTFLGTEFTLIDRGARGAAERIELSRAGPIMIEDVYYTTCAPGSRAWFLEASGITLDRERGLGTARHARLRFGYVPLLYSPWFQFPIDDRRRTGFLFPTFGNTNNTGLDLQVPYYLNLAPNYDAQIIPRFMSQRGTQLAAESRYLLRKHTGHFNYEYLERDEKLQRARAYGSFEHQGLLNRRLALDARYGEVSDQGYFEDLSGKLDAAAITHLERSAQLTYAAPAAYTITARVADYQTVSRLALLQPQFTPYQRLPELRIDALTRKAQWDTRLGFSGEYVNFSRAVEVASEPSQGQRLNLNPYLHFLRDRNAWYLSSRLDWRQTQYKVAGTGATDPSRGLPMFSAE
ncbi:MAG: LPS-assembly protein LptD, partial [Hydrocarboniphaga effusa]|nr:LPS-assembly protein LptD [Hydrocarboniphaga effusa]